MQRHCKTCKFAWASSKPRTIRTPMGVLHQCGGTGFFCSRPGGVTDLKKRPAPKYNPQKKRGKKKGVNKK